MMGDKPLEKGDFFFKKKTYILRVVRVVD